SFLVFQPGSPTILPHLNQSTMVKHFNLFSVMAAMLLSITSALAQAPDGFNYQAVVRDESGNIITNGSVDVRFTIHQTTSSGTTVYQETQSITTNAYGLITAIIGEGTVVSGTFSTIAWSSDDYYLQVEVDNGGGFVDMGSSQLMSVPYAKSADKANTSNMATNMQLNDLTDVNASSPSNGQVLQWNGSNWVAANGGGSGDDWGSQTAATDATLSGDGTGGNPLGIAQQGASNGQFLQWNGSAWVPATVSGSTQWTTAGSNIY